eukprot:799938-Rhodomonas_salina.1
MTRSVESVHPYDKDSTFCAEDDANGTPLTFGLTCCGIKINENGEGARADVPLSLCVEMLGPPNSVLSSSKESRNSYRKILGLLGTGGEFLPGYPRVPGNPSTPPGTRYRVIPLNRPATLDPNRLPDYPGTGYKDNINNIFFSAGPFPFPAFQAQYDFVPLIQSQHKYRGLEFSTRFPQP